MSGDLIPREQIDLDAVENDESVLALVRRLEDLGVLDDVSLRPSDLPVDLTVEQALALGGLFGRFHRSIPWWLGDLIVYCKRRWGHAAVGQIEAITGLHSETLADYERMAETIAPPQRVPGLSFRHHRAVKTLDPGERRGWLMRSVDEGWSSDKLRDKIAAERAQPERPAEHAQAQPPETVVEVARLISNTVMPSVGDCFCLPSDLLVRLRAALGEPT